MLCGILTAWHADERLLNNRGLRGTAANRQSRPQYDGKPIYQALLAEQIGKFTLERVSEGADISFKANAGIDSFGDESCPSERSHRKR